MMREGTPAKLMFVLLEGEFRGRKEFGGDGPVFTIEAPTVTGLLAIFSTQKLWADDSRDAADLGPRILPHEIWRSASASARSFAASRRHVDRSRSQLHRGRAAKPEARGARQTFRGSRARAEQSFGCGATFGRNFARVPGAPARSSPLILDRPRRLRDARGARREDSRLAEAARSTKMNLRASSAKKRFRPGSNAQAYRTPGNSARSWRKRISPTQISKPSPKPRALRSARTHALRHAARDGSHRRRARQQHRPHLRSRESHQGIFLHGSGVHAGSRHRQESRHHADDHASQAQAQHHRHPRLSIPIYRKSWPTAANSIRSGPI